ncbi:hypothetical protein GW796_00690 [archaeon]|nr:hypothetical protein [archaeon]NCQ50422.1 hypothetical protein [archaeon]
MKTSQNLSSEKIKELNKLVLDLFILGHHSTWVTPVNPINLDCIKLKNNGQDPITLFNDNKTRKDVIAKRLIDLISQGADVSKMVYNVAQVNSPQLLQIVFDNGGDPNCVGKNKILPIDRAIYKKRGSLFVMLINHPEFNMNPQVLFSSLKHHRHSLTTAIIEKNIEFTTYTDEKNNSSLLLLAKSCQNKKLNKKVLTIINKCIDYGLNTNHQYNINSANTSGETIFSLSPEIAFLVTEKNALDLASKLPSHNDSYKKTIKI